MKVFFINIRIYRNSIMILVIDFIYVLMVILKLKDYVNRVIVFSCDMDFIILN